MPSKSIIVIGAGIAGLTAAYQLKKAGQDVLVLDMNNYAGGRLANVMWEGFLLTKGASFVTTADKSTRHLLQELGLDDQLIKSSEGFAISTYRDGKLHSVNFLSIPSYLGWSGVSFKARMMAARKPPTPTGRLWQCRAIMFCRYLQICAPPGSNSFQKSSTAAARGITISPKRITSRRSNWPSYRVL